MTKNELIIYVDYSKILKDKYKELEDSIRDLTEFVKRNEPRIIAYTAYLSKEDNSMTVINIHPDSESLEFHGKIGGSEFAKFTNLVKLLKIDVYGEPSNAVLRQLKKKAEMLGGATLNVHDLHTGFNRF